MSQKIVFLGAGGYAKSALDSINPDDYKFCGFIDNFKSIGSNHLGYPILSNSINQLADRENYCYFVSIGDNSLRAMRYNELKELGCKIVNVIDRTSIVSSKASLGNGVFVGKMAIINSGVQIGNNVIINTKALIEHGVCIADNSNVSTNATINGDVKIEEGCFIGSSSVILGQLTVAKNAIVGAGAVVTKNIDAKATVVGVPAKKLIY